VSSDSTTILFGLPGVRVQRVVRAADGARVVHVVTDEETAAACPECGVLSTSVRQRRMTAPRDLPYGQAPLAMRWHKAGGTGAGRARRS
jgi:transposase